MAIQKTILKRYSGTAWDELYLKTSGDIVDLGKAINLASAVAGYNATDTINSTDPVADVIEKLAYPLVQLDKVTVPAIQTAIGESGTSGILKDIEDLKSGTAITEVAASKITGVLGLDQIPHSALERVVTVANDIARLALTTEDIQNGDVCKVTETGNMYFVVDDTKLNIEDGWMPFAAGTAASVAWSGITGKPTTVDGYGITDAVKTTDCATTGSNVVLKTGADGTISVDTTGNAATASSVAFSGITGLDPSVTATALQTAVAQMHTHTNSTVLDALSDSSGNLAYNGTALASQTWVSSQILAAIPLVAEDPDSGTTGQLCLVTIA